MNLTVINKPETTRTDGTVCKFSHAYNPLYVDVVRQDYAITGSGANSGFLVLYLASAADFSINQSVYYLGLNSGSAVVKSGVATIWDKGPNWISLLTPATSQLTPPLPVNVIVSGTINIIATTKREVEITGTIFNGTSDVAFTPRRFSYDNTGTVRVYLNSILQPIFDKNLTIDETIQNGKQKGNNLFISSVFCKDIDTDTEVQILDDTYIAVKSVEQIGNSQQLVNYEVYNDGTNHSTAKFLTAFRKPVYFKNYPHTLMAAIGQVASSVYYRHEHGGLALDALMNISGVGIYKIKIQPVGTEKTFKVSLVSDTGLQDYSLLIDEDGNTLLIDEDGNELLIQN